ncbi:MAG: TonB-dependent receptor plug domain-containing protein [Cyclobacteriaceae bacterium]
MKTLTLIMSIAILTFGCATSKTAQNTSPNAAKVVDSGYGTQLAGNTNQSSFDMDASEADRTISLNDMIQRLPGVSVQGQGPGARIKVMGTESFMAGTSPLFVVNGNVIGNDYRTILSMVEPQKVAKITVLKGSDASIYGTRGANGVISIRTNK